MQPEGVCEVTCPHCFEVFSLPGPSPAECPTEWDYDCEVCCSPMMIRFIVDGERVVAEAENMY
ncbi:MAG: CPXCG motif-containing cysteine-rich protein [Verrucomicrobiota bacterium]